MISCLVESAVNMLDMESCRAWWLRRIHPAGPCCPNCGVAIVGRRAETWAANGRLHCRDCGKFFDNRTGTLLDSCHADWRQLTLLVTLVSAGVACNKIAKACGISDDTVRRMIKRLHLEVKHG